MGVWRLLKSKVGDAFTNTAIDEAILTARIVGLAPNTIRFYRWKPSAVCIGRFQDVFNEVNVENCGKHGVDIVRRITGGGAVNHDYDGEITYSVIVNEKDLGSLFGQETPLILTHSKECEYEYQQTDSRLFFALD